MLSLLACLLPSLLLAVAAQDPKTLKFAALAKANKGVVHLDDQLFDELTAAPRNYSTTVVLTALGPQFKCEPCAKLDPEYRLVAKQWQRQPAHIKNTHFFAQLDFTEGQASFRKLGLNSAPNGRHYQPTVGPRASPSSVEPTRHDFERGGLTAETFASSTCSTLHLPTFFKRPPNYARIASVSVGGLGFAVAAIVAWPFVSFILSSRYIWAAITMPFILAMCSGYMWNQIRSPPWASQGQDGKVNYFASGYSNQYAVETQIIAFIYGVLAFSAYTLISTVPKLENSIRQRVAVYIWLGVFIVMASILLSVFRTKSGGYPYKLLL